MRRDRPHSSATTPHPILNCIPRVWSVNDKANADFLFCRLNRISMPVTNFDLRDLPDVASVLGTGLNSILNDSDDEKHLPTHAHSKSIDSKSFLHMDTTSEQFPILVRRDGETSLQPSASASTLAASQQTAGTESDGWPSFNRHRPGQQSLPMNTLRTPGDEKAAT